MAKQGKIPPDTYHRGIPQPHSAPPYVWQFVAGLSIAASVMLISELLMTMVLREPAMFLFAAPVTVAVVLVVGSAVGWVTDRMTRNLAHARASLVFGAVGLVVGFLWGMPIFSSLQRASEGVAGFDATTLVGGLYVATTAGLGAVAGRYLGPAFALRPRWVVASAASVLVVTLFTTVLLVSALQGA